MDTLLLLAGPLAVAALLRSIHAHNSKNGNSAPSPPSLPLLGHLHLLKKPFHRSLAALSAAHHSPVLSLRLGARRALLVSSIAAAEECFTVHDAAFAGRPRLLAGMHLGYGYTTLVWAPHGEHWSNLRRILAMEVFSTSRLNAFAGDRHDEVMSLIRNIASACATDGAPREVELRPRLFELVLSIMMRAITGRRYCGEGPAVQRFQQIVEETFAVSGPSIADFFPALRWVVRWRGFEERVVRLQAKRDAFLQGIVDEHRRSCCRGGGEGRKSVIDALMSLQENDPEYYTDDIVKGILVVLLSAGTDTSAVTVEWAMAVLLTRPDIMQKAREELDLCVGPGRLVRESDLANLPYLQCIIKETLRLYPAGLLIPAHESTEDCHVAGFHVPRGMLLLVNAWAIHRDPGIWAEPEEFRPERFLDTVRPKEASSSLMLPFGRGRRRCPGEGLALRMVALSLAALIQCFEWGSGGNAVDMAEGNGLTMPMATPLAATCRPRSFLKDLLAVDNSIDGISINSS